MHALMQALMPMQALTPSLAWGVMRRSARMAATALRSADCCGGGKGSPGGQRDV
jgi:hypothetical protein